MNLFLFLLYCLDKDGDGFPDTVEFKTSEEKQIFRDWFKNIALSIYYFKYYSIKDCGDFVRTVLRETLKPHKKIWRRKFKNLIFPPAQDIDKFSYPFIPFLKTKIFRVREGEFDSTTISRDFSSFADTKMLFLYNVHFISKDTSMIRDCDLLFYKVGKSYHVMMAFILKGKKYLLYNTGGTKSKNRLIPLQFIFKLPDTRWHPVHHNACFLGICRLKILD